MKAEEFWTTYDMDSHELNISAHFEWQVGQTAEWKFLLLLSKKDKTKVEYLEFCAMQKYDQEPQNCFCFCTLEHTNISK